MKIARRLVTSQTSERKVGLLKIANFIAVVSCSYT